MNTTNILAVADAIEQHSIPDLGFNMGSFYTEMTDYYSDLTERNCASCACIGGWTNAVVGKERGWDIDTAGFTAASDYLGLNSTQMINLFYAENYPTERKDAEGVDWFIRIPPAQAVRTLRHLAATGQVDWTV